MSDFIIPVIPINLNPGYKMALRFNARYCQLLGLKDVPRICIMGGPGGQDKNHLPPKYIFSSDWVGTSLLGLMVIGKVR